MSQLANQRTSLEAIQASIQATKATLQSLETVEEMMKMSLAAMEAEAQAQATQAVEGPALLMPPLAEGAAEPVAESVAESVKKNKRVFAKLGEALELGTTVRIVSGGDKWVGTFTNGGFKIGEQFYKSPFAFGKAHAQRITEAHPTPTKPGNGWEWIVVDSGQHAGKTIGEVYDARFD